MLDFMALHPFLCLYVVPAVFNAVVIYAWCRLIDEKREGFDAVLVMVPVLNIVCSILLLGGIVVWVCQVVLTDDNKSLPRR